MGTDEAAARRVLITGASSGIGRAFAERLAYDGFDLTLVARRGDALEDLASALRTRRGVEAEVLVADLGQSQFLERVAARIGGEDGLDLLVNSAGFGKADAFVESDVAETSQQIEVNTLALARLTRAALPGMLVRGRGAVINVASMAAFTPLPYLATYAATKAFVVSFSESLHEELRGSGVRVQALCPGPTRTEFGRRAGVDSLPLPSFAWMQPEDVVDASLRALERGRLICVPGAANRLMALATRLLPRAVVRRGATGALLGRWYRRSRPATD